MISVNTMLALSFTLLLWQTSVFAAQRLLPSVSDVSTCDGAFENGGEAQGRQVAPKELNKRIDDVLLSLASDARESLSDGFKANAEAVSDLRQLLRFEKRFKLHGKRIWKDIEKTSQHVVENMESDEDRHSLNYDSFFLSVMLGSLKERIWASATSARAKIESLGGHSEKLLNLHSADDVRTLVNKFFSVATTNDYTIFNDELLYQVGLEISDLYARPELVGIFSDELRATLVNAIERLNRKNTSGARLGVFNELSQSLRTPPYIEGDLEARLVGRDSSAFTGGDKAGDCTAIDDFNCFTIGAWATSFPNIELQVFVRGKFFARAIFIIGTSDKQHTELAAWIHAIEYSPLVRQEDDVSAMAEDMQLGLRFLLRSIKDFTRGAGVKRNFITSISNSSDHTREIETTLSQAPFNVISPNMKNITFTLLEHMTSSFSFADKNSLVLEESETLEDEVLRIYLQGWESEPAVFTRRANDTNVAKHPQRDARDLDYRRAMPIIKQYFIDRLYQPILVLNLGELQYDVPMNNADDFMRYVENGKGFDIIHLFPRKLKTAFQKFMAKYREYKANGEGNLDMGNRILFENELDGNLRELDIGYRSFLEDLQDVKTNILFLHDSEVQFARVRSSERRIQAVLDFWSTIDANKVHGEVYDLLLDAQFSVETAEMFASKPKQILLDYLSLTENDTDIEASSSSRLSVFEIP